MNSYGYNVQKRHLSFYFAILITLHKNVFYSILNLTRGTDSNECNLTGQDILLLIY